MQFVRHIVGVVIKFLFDRLITSPKRTRNSAGLWLLKTEATKRGKDLGTDWKIGLLKVFSY